MLNTNEVKPHLSKYWCIPKENDSHFVAHMEDILGIYQREYNPKIPVICMDEKSIQLLDEIIARVSAKPLRTDPDTDKCGRKEKVTETEIEAMKARLKEKPDMTINEMITELKLDVTESCISKRLKKAGITFKKRQPTQKSRSGQI